MPLEHSKGAQSGLGGTLSVYDKRWLLSAVVAPWAHFTLTFWLCCMIATALKKYVIILSIDLYTFSLQSKWPKGSTMDVPNIEFSRWFRRKNKWLKESSSKNCPGKARKGIYWRWKAAFSEILYILSNISPKWADADLWIKLQQPYFDRCPSCCFLLILIPSRWWLCNGHTRTTLGWRTVASLNNFKLFTESLYLSY